VLKTTSNTAILIFANSAGIESARKNIPQSKALFTFLNTEIISKVKRTGLPYFLYSEELQVGFDFGARFTTAIQAVFSKGFEHIITVGNDTPNLSVATLIRSYESLMQGKTVIGPSTDGGVYLLGIHKNRFDPVSFRELPWQKQNLFQETACLYLKKGMLYQLPRLGDIDNLDDVQVIIDQRETISLSLLHLLLNLTRKKNCAESFDLNYSELYYIERPFNKGSPYLPF
jgi:glycosyltransferase A (GT-A) superfamily protein (DUF2064 family)